jgi:polyribonucleotide nucleotidyltransferase
MSRYLTMLDIIGSEDHFGDMDFKLCGTSEGVTGYQLDLKLPASR